MFTFHARQLLLVLLLVCHIASVHADHPKVLRDVTITGEYSGFEKYMLNPELINAPAADSAELLKKIPGANVNSNGTVTGIAQYRGMYGDRVNILLDGIKISPGGPNAMDTPISYVPRAQLESIEIFRGIAPVSSGNETIGGSMQVKSNSGKFAETEQPEFHGKVSVAGHSVNDGYDVSTLLSVANNKHRFHVAGSRQDSDDFEFPDGEVTPSEHDRNSYKAGYGLKLNTHEFGLEYVRNDTNESGTPALPMDIIYIDTDIARGNYIGEWNQVSIESKLYWSEVEHRMSNFELRLPPLVMGGPMTMQRFSKTGSEDYGYSFSASIDFAGGKLQLGTDGHLAEHYADVFNPLSTAFVINNYRDIERDVFGFFGEWHGKLINDWELELGLRYTHVNMDAGTVSARGFPMAPMQTNADLLAAAFNAADRSQDDNNVDAVMKFSNKLTERTQLELGFARKTRSPSYQERYLWLPLQSTGGLADGNNYIGNINLESEVAYQFELGFDFRNNLGYFAPRAFYHHVDDYIQGVDATNPTAIAFNTMANNMTGRSSKILQFANVDARLYGVDADFGYHITPSWLLDGAISYVKGERRDNGDNLYRITPVNTRVGLTHQRNNWSATVETVAYLDKEDVSQVTNELETAGYMLLNLYGNYTVTNTGLTLVAGIDNVLDKEYAPHLGGVNRVRNVDVPVGVRIPGPGINGYVNMTYSW